jgi:transcription elongation factor GreA
MRLSRQLLNLQKEMLEVTLPEIEKAREFSNNEDNDEMIHARQHQSNYENRIADLERLINESDVIEKIDFTGAVDYGTDVYIQNSETGVKRWIRIVGEMESESRAEISFKSPFGQAMIGHVVGDEVEIRAPGGTQCWEILEVKVANAFSGISESESSGQV